MRILVADDDAILRKELAGLLREHGHDVVGASAIELRRRFGIPIAACYRRIKELEGSGLVYGERAQPSRNGRGLQRYRSRLRSVRIAFEDGKLRARVELGPMGLAAAPENEVTEQVMNLREPSSTA